MKNECPYCGGLPGENRTFCNNCRGELSWVRGYPCKPSNKKQLTDQFEFAKQSEDKKTKRADIWANVVVFVVVFGWPVPLALFLASDSSMPIRDFVLGYVGQIFIVGVYAFWKACKW